MLYSKAAALMSKFSVGRSYKIIKLFVALTLLMGAGLLLHSKPAYADTYNPNPNDVAIQGRHAEINAPTSHFLIRADGTNPKVDVTIAANGTCVRTAGVPGLQATIDGRTIVHNGDNLQERTGS